jgi:hypothetical protein
MEHIGGKPLRGRLAAVAIGVNLMGRTMNDQRQPHPHLVIVGIGFGGVSAAKVIAGAAFDVTAIDRSRIIVALNWAWSYITIQQGSCLVTGLHNTRRMPRDELHATAS